MQGQGTPHEEVADLRRELEDAEAQRAELERRLEIAKTESAELRESLEALERERTSAAGPEAGAQEPLATESVLAEAAETLAGLRNAVVNAEAQRRALAGLISDAADVHRGLGAVGNASPPVPEETPSTSRPRLRGRLARTPLAAPVRKARARRRRRSEEKASADGDGEPGRPAAPTPAPLNEAAPDGGASVLRLAEPPVAIEMNGLEKAFQVPSHRVDSLKERLVHHPFRRLQTNRHVVFSDIDVTVRSGESLGIVGTNGAGKSTLLKVIAGIYKADAGSVRVAGRVAPLIELGVGFRSDLSARDNVILSATLMGLSPERARERYPEVLEFAGLEEFAELKLRNYSSGMRVRLAFAVMMQVEADVFLIDEVLAVGDAPFQERCTRALSELHRAGKTILLVSHSMEKVRAGCERAILLDGGRVILDGTPDEVAARYDEVMAGRKVAKRYDRLPAIGGTVAERGGS